MKLWGRVERRPTTTVETVQVLRGIAALLVVVHHTVSMWLLLWPDSIRYSIDGSRGVDVFFVVSGFIMPLSVRHLGSRMQSAGVFLKRRLERIVPLYWIFTTLRVLMPSAAEKNHSTYHVVASYLFLPSFNGIHEIVPALPPGWTLNLEMVFYVLIAWALLMGVRLRYFLPPVLVALAMVSYLHIPSNVPIDPSRMSLFVEFLFGMLLARRFLAIGEGSRLLPPALAAAIFFLSMASLLRDGRLLVTLPPSLVAFLVVGSAIEMERSLHGRLPRLLLLLGDSSYSLYLSHWFVIGVAHKLLAGHLSGVTSFPLVLLTILTAACAVGIGCYYGIERPINRYFHVRRHAAVTA